MAKSLQRTPVAIVRHVTGLTVEQFAELVGKSPHTIRSLESGRLKLGDKLAKTIEYVTDASADWLRDGGEPRTREGEPFNRENYEIFIQSSEFHHADKHWRSFADQVADQLWNSLELFGQSVWSENSEAVLSELETFNHQLAERFRLKTAGVVMPAFHQRISQFWDSKSKTMIKAARKQPSSKDALPHSNS